MARVRTMKEIVMKNRQEILQWALNLLDHHVLNHQNQRINDGLFNLLVVRARTHATSSVVDTQCSSVSPFSRFSSFSCTFFGFSFFAYHK